MKETVWTEVRECRRCLSHKPLSEFYISNSKHSDGYRSECKECSSHSWRKQTYGISKPDYITMLKMQGGVCAICGKGQRNTTKKKALSVDHCHASGKIRGLLCSACNSAIGHLEDDIPRMSSAIDYLKKHLSKTKEL